MTNGVLHVYSSGAVAPPIQRCAEQFKDKFNVEFTFTIGKAEELLAALAKSKEGDILTCGAEYILDNAENLDLIIKETRRSVGYRKSAILVPAGNPKKIRSLLDLTRDYVKIGISVSGCLVGVWDDVCAKAGLIDQIRKNMSAFADGCGALVGLINERKVDTAFGWDAFKKLWPKTLTVVDLPEKLQVYRSTGITAIKFSNNVELAKKFIDFTVSKDGKKIYQEYGWHHIC